MAVDSKLVDLLEQIFERVREGSEDKNFDKHRSDFVFHMTDWQGDLEKLYQMYINPEAWEPDSACDFVVGFLYHVVPHVRAAAKLLVGSTGDPFSHSD